RSRRHCRRRRKRRGLRLPHGVAPTAPVNGDLWSTTAGWFVRTNGAAQQLAIYNAAATFAGVNVGGALTGATAGSFSGAVSTAALSATSGTFTSTLSVNNGAELNVWGPGSTVRLRFVNDGTTGYLQGAALNLCGIGGGNTVATVTGSLQVAGVVSPGADNAYTLGSASFRWSQLYAGTATINTSDPREKTALADVPEALLDAILAVPIGAYQWLDSVARKGPDQARIHFGPTAQDVRDAILAKGLDPERFALFCKDPKLARVAKTRIVTRPVAPEIVRIEKVVIEGGRAILKAIAEERAVTRKVTVEDENGAPVMRSMPVAGADSSHDTGPAFEPLTAEIPVTEEVEETYETFEPVTGEFVYGLRLEQFYALLGLAIRRKAGF
ncbi:MAG: tail fiber domain-containing protein, partial [Microvirga sp.]